MQRPCAYCKKSGHHIRYCALLLEKNRRQFNIPTPTPKVAPPPTLKNIFISTNKYANLFESSEDEVEEGEIVEERTVRLSVPISPLIHPSPSKDLDSSNEKWVRSGIKVIPIQIQEIIKDKNNEPNDEVPEIIDYEQVNSGLTLFERLKKYRGRSWADIENDSDIE